MLEVTQGWARCPPRWLTPLIGACFTSCWSVCNSKGLGGGPGAYGTHHHMVNTPHGLAFVTCYAFYHFSLTGKEAQRGSQTCPKSHKAHRWESQNLNIEAINLAL